VITNTHFGVLIAIAESSIIFFHVLYLPVSKDVVSGMSHRKNILGTNSIGVVDVMTLNSFCIFFASLLGKSLSTCG